MKPDDFWDDWQYKQGWLGGSMRRKIHYVCEQKKNNGRAAPPPVRDTRHFWGMEKDCATMKKWKKSAMRGREGDSCILNHNSYAPPDRYHWVTDRKTQHEERDTKTDKTSPHIISSLVCRYCIFNCHYRDRLKSWSDILICNLIILWSHSSSLYSIKNNNTLLLTHSVPPKRS